MSTKETESSANGLVAPRSKNAKEILSRVALFLGELRDGLTMVSMCSAY